VSRSPEPAPRVTFLPMSETLEARPGESVLDIARRNRLRIASSCGGQGRCMSCTIKFVDGPAPAPADADKRTLSQRRLDEGWRRACLAVVEADCEVHVPPRSTAAPVRTHVDGTKIDVNLDPTARSYIIDLAPPTLADTKADDQRLIEAINAETPGAIRGVDVDVLRQLSPSLREWGWRIKASVHSGEIVAIGPENSLPLGIAVDLGTTNISGTLVNLETGETLAVQGMENPQTAYGGDVISYAAYVRRTENGAAVLQQSVVEALNDLAIELTDAAGERPAQVAEIVVAGNTMMHHLLAGLPVAQLAASPFVAAASEALDLRARDLGIHIAPGGIVHLVPNIAGFVGGDHTAMLLATETAAESKVVLAMDIGTNTEISLLENGRITSVSCPSGPALEGGHISCGMRAAAGAIEQVRITENSASLETIEDGKPAGICGSGVLDTVAQLYLTGVVDNRGRLQLGHPCVVTQEGNREFVLAGETVTGGPPVVFDQDDIRAVQLAKAAIRSATDLLLSKTGHEERDLDHVIIAGAFGNYIDIGSAIALGMLPDIPFSRYSQVGNAAGDGARQILVSKSHRRRAQEIADNAHYLELAGAEGFMSAYVGRINFKPAPGLRHIAPTVTPQASAGA
jgi:uncharacterized 2Fe-2S/4Fe-4S cluster protein (DUF4445 family)